MKLKVALDNTPNILHAGLLLADYNNHFKHLSLQVDFVSPSAEAGSTTQMLAEKQVHMAVMPAESIICYNTMINRAGLLVAVATMLQQDINALVSLADTSVDRPARVDEKILGLHHHYLEEAIVQQLVIKDGGKGIYQVKNLSPDGVLQALLEHAVDAAWISLPWQGVRAEQEGKVKLSVFKPRDFNIPYGYSSLLVTHQDFIIEEELTIKAFLKGAEKGWRDVYKNPEKAVRQLQKHSNFADKELVKKSLEAVSPALFNEENQWGFMEGYHWVDFIDWMVQVQILKDQKGVPMNHGQVDSSMFYTNEFFKK